ncbi:MAG: hypothetical protein WBA77_16330 [Microcoleaceae cyanobacterium]
MIEPPLDSCTRSMALLNEYSFDLNSKSTEEVIIEWLTEYPPNWIDLAVIEALYQGRYKAFSVSQILSLWQRREKPSYHFTAEFEHLVCKNIVQELDSENDQTQNDLESVDQLNNPASSPPYDSAEQIILRPIQTLVIPIQYPNFFDKLKAFAGINSDFLKQTEDRNKTTDIIDVLTVETSQIIESD